ncbi:Histone-lysine N-methyltransferase SETMAR [Melipona quadrifasciata]|uniref:Histone-lysine N-methyltransferase SETMAR n=1 Tax=Melipona quadrifasciata TaxID=166423 RepID=A0A0N0BKK0_9HYME|nr:Histone-lysine N-methyltransferase SETMAR [Melipona quadrifasciata]
MLHCFKKGNTADEIFTVYGSGTTTIRTVRNWFKKFRAGNFECSGRPATTDTDIIKTVLTENPRYNMREIVDATDVPKITVHEHLIKIGYANRYEVWVPHLLTETGLMNRVSTCDLLVQRHERDPFLKRFVTGDETWILYVPRKRTWSKENRSSTVAKPRLDPKKVLQPVAEKRLELANRRGDNARPHVALSVRQKLLQFKSKLKQFWKEGIMRLPERWKKVIEQNGSYIT